MSQSTKLSNYYGNFYRAPAQRLNQGVNYRFRQHARNRNTFFNSLWNRQQERNFKGEYQWPENTIRKNNSFEPFPKRQQQIMVEKPIVAQIQQSYANPVVNIPQGKIMRRMLYKNYQKSNQEAISQRNQIEKEKQRNVSQQYKDMKNQVYNQNLQLQSYKVQKKQQVKKMFHDDRVNKQNYRQKRLSQDTYNLQPNQQAKSQIRYQNSDQPGFQQQSAVNHYRSQSTLGRLNQRNNANNYPKLPKYYRNKYPMANQLSTESFNQISQNNNQQHVRSSSQQNASVQVQRKENSSQQGQQVQSSQSSQNSQKPNLRYLRQMNMQKYQFDHNPVLNPMSFTIQNPYIAKEINRVQQIH